MNRYTNKNRRIISESQAIPARFTSPYTCIQYITTLSLAHQPTPILYVSSSNSGSDEHKIYVHHLRQMPSSNFVFNEPIDVARHKWVNCIYKLSRSLAVEAMVNNIRDKWRGYRPVVNHQNLTNKTTDQSKVYIPTSNKRCTNELNKPFLHTMKPMTTRREKCWDPPTEQNGSQLLHNSWGKQFFESEALVQITLHLPCSSITFLLNQSLKTLAIPNPWKVGLSSGPI